VASDAVVPLPEGVPVQLAAVLGCAVLTGTGAVLRTAKVRPGDTVAVIGLGGVGLSAVAGAAIAKASKIIAVDASSDKEALARRAGATEFVLAGENLAKQVRQLTDGLGADHTFECVGRAETIRQAWKSARRGGTCVVVGLGRADDRVSFSAQEIFHSARIFTSSVYGSSDPPKDLPDLAGYVRDGQLDLAGLVTHRIGLDEVPAAFARMQEGRGGRSIVVMDSESITGN
jgi:S-(hydroxymethyl)glutathione dehydrogenase / alcohol dehydrogenase